MYTFPNEIEPPIHFANACWAVTNYGLESLTIPYAIERSRLNDRWYAKTTLSDWIIQISGKSWGDLDSFCQAFEKALLFHRVKGRTLIDVIASRREAQREREADELYELADRVGGLPADAGMKDLAVLRQLLAEERNAASKLSILPGEDREAVAEKRADLIWSLSAGGMTIREISRQTALSRTTVNRVLIEERAKRKSSGQPCLREVISKRTVAEKI